MVVIRTDDMHVKTSAKTEIILVHIGVVVTVKTTVGVADLKPIEGKREQLVCRHQRPTGVVVVYEKTVFVRFVDQIRNESIGKLVFATLARVMQERNIVFAVAGREIFGIEADGNVVVWTALDQAEVMHLHVRIGFAIILLDRRFVAVQGNKTVIRKVVM